MVRAAGIARGGRADADGALEPGLLLGAAGGRGRERRGARLADAGRRAVRRAGRAARRLRRRHAGRAGHGAHGNSDRPGMGAGTPGFRSRHAGPRPPRAAGTRRAMIPGAPAFLLVPASSSAWIRASPWTEATMRPITLVVALAGALAAPRLTAQLPAPANDILRRLFASREFLPERLRPARWIDSSHA